jgi:hypothetical protein
MAFKKLIVRWDKRQNDHVVSFPRKCDGHLAYGMFFTPRMKQDFDGKGFNGVNFDPSYAKELEARGYDLTTLRFEISPKKEAKP